MANIVTNKFRVKGTEEDVKKFIKFFTTDRIFNVDFNKVIPLVDDNEKEAWGAGIDKNFHNGHCTHCVERHKTHNGMVLDFEINSRWAVPEIAFRKLCVMFPTLNFESIGYEGGFGWKYIMTVLDKPVRTEDDVIFEYSKLTNYDNAVIMREFV